LAEHKPANSSSPDRLDRRIHLPTERPYSDIAHVAIAVKAINARQRHVGIIHCGEQDRRPRLLHLKWDDKLTEEAPDNSFVWISPRIPDRRAKQLAARCRQIFRANGRFVLYGWSEPTDCFDPQTAKHLFGDGSDRTGLTCASFVLAVFEFARLRLIRYRTWVARADEDAEWQRWIVELLSRAPTVAPARIEALRRGIGGFRFRPEEVGGAAARWPPASNFIQATEAAAHILTKLYPESSGPGDLDSTP
jgi:hypothetical protein